MKVSYANKRIQKNCDTIANRRKAFGDRRAQALEARIQQLEEAVCLEDLRFSPGHWHELTGERKGQIAADVGQPYRLIVIPTDDPPPTKPDGGLDWKQITAVTVVDVTNYH